VATIPARTLAPSHAQYEAFVPLMVVAAQRMPEGWVPGAGCQVPGVGCRGLRTLIHAVALARCKSKLQRIEPFQRFVFC